MFSWRALPGLAEVERLILSARRRKAAGFDGITVEMLRLQPTAAARRLFPLLAKTAVTLHEPVAFRGGADDSCQEGGSHVPL